MKKFYFILLLSGLMMGLSTSCSDDDGQQDPYIPTPPQVSIENLSGQTTCLPGETIELKAKLTNPLPTTFQWQLDKKTVSTDSIYRFTPEVPGSFELILMATNKDGKDSDTLALEVTGKRFTISDLKHWTGNGDNSSVFAIQWVTGDNISTPKDQDVFFIAWGYHWNDADTPKGIDMLKAIAGNDPRLFVVISGNYIKGFGYDGNNDGKIELRSSTIHLTQDDFTDGFCELSDYDPDELKPVDSGDYWMGSSKAYTTYWIGSGNRIPTSTEFEYSQAFVTNRQLENLSWDVWTLSPIDFTSMVNVSPIPLLIKAAEANQ